MGVHLREKITYPGRLARAARKKKQIDASAPGGNSAKTIVQSRTAAEERGGRDGVGRSPRSEWEIRVQQEPEPEDHEAENTDVSFFLR